MMVLVRQARHDATFSRQSAAGGDQAENGLEQYTVRFHPATGLADVTCFTGGGETLVLLDARMLSPGTSEHRVVTLLSEIESASHLLLWARHTDTGLQLVRVDLPRLNTSFVPHAVYLDGSTVVRLRCCD